MIQSRDAGFMSVFVHILMFMHKLLDDLHEIGESQAILKYSSARPEH